MIESKRILGRRIILRVILVLFMALLASACQDVSEAEQGSSSLSSAPSDGPTSGEPPASAPSPAPHPPNPSDPFALQVFDQTNAYRVSNGLAPLKWNAKLAQAAQSYAEAMATQGFFSHTSPDGSTPGDRIAGTGYSASAWGENIAYGYRTPDDVMQGWISSPGHRANILGAYYQEIGVGYFVKSGSSGGAGTAYWVQDFGSQRGTRN